MSSGFVSEAELEEKRRARQEEWEKVRQADQPEEAPEEVYDHRSLFDRLEEQKQKKQMDYEEAHKLKNMIKGLDDDEVEFLDFVDRKKMEAEQLKELEEKEELREFRRNVEKLKESTLDERIQAEIRGPKVNATNNTSSNTRSQHKLLKGVVVKRKANDAQCNGTTETARSNNQITSNSNSVSTENEAEKKESENSPSKKRKRDSGESQQTAALTCVGILPGLGNYLASSDSDSDSSNSDEPECTFTKYDLLGRKLGYAPKVEKTKSH